jgi:flagellar FliL protein
MAEQETTPETDGDTAVKPAKPRKSGKAILIGVGLALALGAGGFYAAYSGLLPIGGEGGESAVATPLPDIAFVPMPPMLINLGASGSGRHLRFSAELEVAKTSSGDVTHLLPRIQDVLNGYLRAVEVADLEDPAALIRLRAQMLRRVQVVVGAGRVRDLLVTEFVLN